MDIYKIYETWTNDDRSKFQSIAYLSNDIQKPKVNSELNILLVRLYYDSKGQLLNINAQNNDNGFENVGEDNVSSN